MKLLDPVLTSFYFRFQIVDVNLTSESRVKLELNAKLPFTYEVIWKQTDTKFVDRFDKYLDPNFFQHRVRKLFWHFILKPDYSRDLNKELGLNVNSGRGFPLIFRFSDPHCSDFSITASTILKPSLNQNFNFFCIFFWLSLNFVCCLKNLCLKQICLGATLPFQSHTHFSHWPSLYVQIRNMHYLQPSHHFTPSNINVGDIAQRSPYRQSSFKTL